MVKTKKGKGSDSGSDTKWGESFHQVTDYLTTRLAHFDGLGTSNFLSCIVYSLKSIIDGIGLCLGVDFVHQCFTNLVFGIIVKVTLTHQCVEKCLMIVIFVVIIIIVLSTTHIVIVVVIVIVVIAIVVIVIVVIIVVIVVIIQVVISTFQIVC